ncbi:MAG TPA: archaemetzincin [Bryobacteraceae bacterium]|nr:archaemetzincin [Bryobacteraceae bacterium]
MAIWRGRNGSPTRVLLAPVGDFPDALLERLSRRANMPVGDRRLNPAPAWNANRGQYDSTRLIAELRRLYDVPVVGAAAVDLFVPVLTFVFGEAEMPGRAAVFSICRLREEFYGLPQNPALVEARAVRELWHEFGHTQGLAHCRDSACVMSSSHSVVGVDSKTDQYCLTCEAKLAKAREVKLPTASR